MPGDARRADGRSGHEGGAPQEGTEGWRPPSLRPVQKAVKPNLLPGIGLAGGGWLETQAALQNADTGWEGARSVRVTPLPAATLARSARSDSGVGSFFGRAFTAHDVVVHHNRRIWRCTVPCRVALRLRCSPWAFCPTGSPSLRVMSRSP